MRNLFRKSKDSGLKFFADAVIVGVLALAPLSVQECPENDSEPPPPDNQVEIEIEVHRQGYQQEIYNPFPLDVAPLSQQLALKSISLRLTVISTLLTQEWLDGDPNFLYAYAKTHASQSFGFTSVKRQLFAVKGLYKQGTTDWDCEHPGRTVYDGSYNYSEMWVSFIACGTKQNCYPVTESSFDQERIEAATIHELGHLASHYIPHCAENISYHGVPCIMYYIAPDDLWPYSQHVMHICSHGSTKYPLSFNYCGTCRGEIRERVVCCWPDLDD